MWKLSKFEMVHPVIYHVKIDILGQRRRRKKKKNDAGIEAGAA